MLLSLLADGTTVWMPIQEWTIEMGGASLGTFLTSETLMHCELSWESSHFGLDLILLSRYFGCPGEDSLS